MGTRLAPISLGYFFSLKVYGFTSSSLDSPLSTPSESLGPIASYEGRLVSARLVVLLKSKGLSGCDSGLLQHPIFYLYFL